MARNKYDIDEDLNRSFNMETLARLGVYLKPHLKTVLVTVVIMVVASLAGLLPPKLIQMAMDEAMPRKDVAQLLRLGLFMVMSLGVGSICMALRIRLMSRMGQSVVQTMRSDIFARVQQLPFTYFDTRPHGKILIRVVNYVNSISDLLSNGLINFITDLVSLFFIIGFMFFIEPRLTLICLAAMPVLGLAILLLKKKQRTTWQVMSRKQSNLNAYLHEALSGVKVTQSFAREGTNEGIFGGLGGEWKDSWLKAVANLFLVWPVIEILSVLVVCIVYASGVLWLKDTITVGILVAFVAYIWRFWAPIQTIGNFYSSLIQSAAYLERIFETIDEPVDILDRPGAVDLPPVKGRVEFKAVRFSYDEGQVILPHMDFTVEAGQTIAIVGPTGAGKTTIVNLLSRFYNPDSGQILIDGHDLQDVTLASLRSRTGVMLQDPFLFSGTIRDNIRYGRLDATDAQVEEAAMAVHAHDFIMGLEQGYDTPVNERGMRLSMGQRQLISFARVLLADPAILILDEATSAVDTETERLIQKGIARLLAGRTSFVIAHRLSTIRNADRIFYLDHGRIVESGTHAQLLDHGGYYAHLYQSGRDAALSAAARSGAEA